MQKVSSQNFSGKVWTTHRTGCIYSIG